MLSCRGKDYHCALVYAVDIIGGKWKPRILLALDDGQPAHFGSLERELPDTSRKVLTRKTDCDKPGIWVPGFLCAC